MSSGETAGNSQAAILREIFSFSEDPPLSPCVLRTPRDRESQPRTIANHTTTDTLSLGSHSNPAVSSAILHSIASPSVHSLRRSPGLRRARPCWIVGHHHSSPAKSSDRWAVDKGSGQQTPTEQPRGSPKAYCRGGSSLGPSIVDVRRPVFRQHGNLQRHFFLLGSTGSVDLIYTPHQITSDTG